MFYRTRSQFFYVRTKHKTTNHRYTTSAQLLTQRSQQRAQPSSKTLETFPFTKAIEKTKSPAKSHHHHHHLSLTLGGRWGITDDSLMLSSHLFLCLPCLLPRFTVPCKMVLARPDERQTRPYHCSLRLFAMVRRSSGDN